MKLAVTGATGFVGRAFLRAVLDAGHQVAALIRPGRSRPSVTRLTVVEGDLSKTDPLRRLVHGADAVVHLAALGVQSRDRDPAAMAAANVDGAVRLAEVMAAAGVRRLVAAGSVLELSPGDAYGVSKAASRLRLAEATARLGLSGWYLRLASLYGPGDDPQKLLPAAIAAARAGQPFEMTPGEQVREWLHVDDAVAALLRACELPPPGPLDELDVGTGEGVALVALVREVYRLAGRDEGLVRAGAKPYRPGEVMYLVMDPARAMTALGWAPRISLQEGLRRLLAA